MGGPTTDSSSSQEMRVASTFQPQWQRFMTELIAPSHVAAISQKNTSQKEVHPYQRQYAHVYHQRLTQLTPACRKAFKVQEKNEKIVQVERLLELEDDVLSFVVGTLVKEASPNNKNPGDPLVEGSTCRASDCLYLEDESGRIQMEISETQDFHIHSFCTGLVLGVCGRVTLGGCLKVDSFVFPSVDPPEPLQPSPENEPYILLLSGIHCGSTSHSPLTRDMLLTFLEGRLSHPAASKVSRVVICGGLIAESGLDSRSDALRDLDAFLFQVTAGAGIPVDILPGEKDPTTANWPQRPIHSSLIAQSSRFGLVKRTPNPLASTCENCALVATDGINVRDMQNHILVRSKEGEEEVYERSTELSALRYQLECGHICPTGPTTVPTMPHPLKDPMVMNKWPHIYAAGNCSKFATDLMASPLDTSRKCRAVCVPKFCETGEAVLVNLANLKVDLLRFED